MFAWVHYLFRSAPLTLMNLSTFGYAIVLISQICFFILNPEWNGTWFIHAPTISCTGSKVVYKWDYAVGTVNRLSTNDFNPADASQTSNKDLNLKGPLSSASNGLAYSFSLTASLQVRNITCLYSLSWVVPHCVVT